MINNEEMTLAHQYGLSEEDFKNLLKALKNDLKTTSLITPANIGEKIKETSALKLLTGISEIDTITKGGLKKGVHVIAGFRKCCKSTLAINLIYRALNNGMNICLLSLEMTKRDVLNILISLHTFELDNKTAKTRDEIDEMYVNNRKQYDEYLNSLLSLTGNLVIFDETDIEKNVVQEHGYTTIIMRDGPYSAQNLNDLFNRANKDCYENNGNSVQLLVVDNLNCIRVWENKNSGETVYTQASNFFRRSANNFGSRSEDNSYGNEPVICLLLCQINRTGGKAAEYEGYYPDSCIAETINIERDATSVLTIYHNPNVTGKNGALIKLEASRYSKSMDGPARIPINLEFGKIGLPIQYVNIDATKMRLMQLKDKYRLVKCFDASGKKQISILAKDVLLPDGYKEINDSDDEEEDGIY